MVSGFCDRISAGTRTRRAYMTPCGKVNPTRSIHVPITSTAPTPIHSFSRNDLQARQCHRLGGQAVCCDTTPLAREALRPPVRSLPSKGRFAAPCTPRRRTRPGSSIFARPCAGWMRGNGISRCIENQESLAPPIPPASGFRARHHDQRPAALDWQQERGPCTPVS
jgi:hypothetical protein